MQSNFYWAYVRIWFYFYYFCQFRFVSELWSLSFTTQNQTISKTSLCSDLQTSRNYSEALKYWWVHLQSLQGWNGQKPKPENIFILRLWKQSALQTVTSLRGTCALTCSPFSSMTHLLLLFSFPQQAPVWEITGAEFSKSEMHTADGISIRFPRMTRIRDDKDWKTATNLHQLKVETFICASYNEVLMRCHKRCTRKCLRSWKGGVSSGTGWCSLLCNITRREGNRWWMRWNN